MTPPRLRLRPPRPSSGNYRELGTINDYGAKTTYEETLLYPSIFNGFTAGWGGVKWGKFRGVRRPDPVGGSKGLRRQTIRCELTPPELEKIETRKVPMISYLKGMTAEAIFEKSVRYDRSETKVSGN